MTNNLSITKEFQLSNRFAVAKPIEHKRSQTVWLNFGAGLGLAGGLLAGVVGFLLTGMSWLLGNEVAASSVGQSATWLIIAMIPLMAFGAHCLDKIEAIKKAEKIEFYRRHGLVNRNWQ
ncbi:MAG: hypothetical protein M3R14_17245 [Acidobacteriota bacterium]|nr:hypothetical protein [Acidobacteriota bacterium]